MNQVKVLFVSSGNRLNRLSEIVRNQGDSLIFQGIDVDYYLIKGSGVKGYLKNILPLLRIIKKNKYSLIHAHYLFSAITASLTFKKPLLVSLMGSEVSKNKIYIFLIRVLNKFFWSGLVVKTERMSNILNIRGVRVLPNGVNMVKFIPMDKIYCQSKLGWASDKKHILFASQPERKEKNFELARSAINFLMNDKIEMHYLKDIPNNDLVFYYNSADVILLTSKREGSPNVIKEAMACNRPIVATDVGDISKLIDNLENCYLTSFKPEDVARKLNKAIDTKTFPDGRKRLTELSLDSESVAIKLIKIYSDTLNKARYRT